MVTILVEMITPVIIPEGEDPLREETMAIPATTMDTATTAIIPVDREATAINPMDITVTMAIQDPETMGAIIPAEMTIPVAIRLPEEITVHVVDTAADMAWWTARTPLLHGNTFPLKRIPGLLRAMKPPA